MSPIVNYSRFFQTLCPTATSPTISLLLSNHDFIASVLCLALTMKDQPLISGIITSRVPLGISVCLLLLVLQFQVNNQVQPESIDLSAIRQRNATKSSPTEANASHSPIDPTIKKRNVYHSDNPLDYNIFIIHYHKTGNQLSKDFLRLMSEEGNKIGLKSKAGSNHKRKRNEQKLIKQKRLKHEKEKQQSPDQIDDQQFFDESMERTYANNITPTSTNKTECVNGDCDNGHMNHVRNLAEDDYNLQDDSNNDQEENDDDDDEYSGDDDDDDDIDNNGNTEVKTVCLHRNLRKGSRRKKSRSKRYHSLKTYCPKLRVRLGHASILTAPDFFCSIDELERVLMPNSTMDMLSNKNRTVGTKIIHMVRDPFEMALSNYFYHSQEPTPESWVKDDCNPCDTEYFDRGGHPTNTTNLDLLLPNLNAISISQIKDIRSLCNSIFQNSNNHELLHASFYDHLRNLEDIDGLRLSTSRQIIGSGGPYSKAGGDLLRMVNNAVKLHQLVQHDRNKVADIQVMTTYMSQWTHTPYDTTLAALDFILGDSVSQFQKEAVANKYKEKYQTKASDPEKQHITSTKTFVREQKEELLDLLRQEPVLEPVLRELSEVLLMHS